MPPPSTTPSGPDPLVGRVLAGKLRLDAVLGEGAMGKVYRAQHLTLDKTVAIKVMHAQQGADPSRAARFKAEARAASRIEHPNTVQILDFGEDGEDRLLYLAMELLAGRDLQAVANEVQVFDVPRTVRIMVQVLSALGAAHDRGVIHRDMKPGNIMLVERDGLDGPIADFVKVCDFGLAKIHNLDGTPYEATSGPLTQQGAVFGTPAYMSPEQARGAPLDTRSDLYACGVILFKMITGRTPFAAETPWGVLMGHIHQPPPPPRSLRADVDAELERITLRAMEKDPDARYPHARDMRADLMAALESFAASAPGGTGGLALRGLSAVMPDSLAALRAAAPTTPAAPGGLAFADTVVPRVEPTAALSAPAPALPLGSLAPPTTPAVDASLPPTRRSSPVALLATGAGLVVLGVFLANLLRAPGPDRVATAPLAAPVAAEASPSAPEPAAAVPAPDPVPDPPAGAPGVAAPPPSAGTPEAAPRAEAPPAAEPEPTPAPPEPRSRRPSRRPTVARAAAVAVAPAERPPEAEPPTAAAPAPSPPPAAAPAPTPPPAAPAASPEPPRPAASLPADFRVETSLRAVRVRGGLSRGAVEKGLARVVDELGACLRPGFAARGRPGQTQRVSASGTIDNRGRLRSISVDGAPTACATEVLERARLPRADTGNGAVELELDVRTSP
jgi:tRNA A-37 threonylcarbamoyl transferase component Bud32